MIILDPSVRKDTIIFLKILFIYSWETERERGRDPGRGKSRLHAGREPDVGLDPRTPGSHPGPEGTRSTTDPPRCPVDKNSYIASSVTSQSWPTGGNKAESLCGVIGAFKIILRFLSEWLAGGIKHMPVYLQTLFH